MKLEHYLIMTILVMFGVISALFIIVCDQRTTLNEREDALDKFTEYYNATETLLDSLESTYNWIDGMGGDEVDAYYETRKNVYW